jgi:serine protease Do
MKGVTMLTGRSVRRAGSFGLVVVIAMAGLAHGAGAQRLRRTGYSPVPAAAGAGGQRGSQGYLGVVLRDVSEDQRGALKVKDARGAEITYVDHDGPAGKAGLREHDVILVMDGQTIEGQDQLRRMLGAAAPGKAVTLVISRDGQQQTISAQMANRVDVEREAWQQHVVVAEPATDAAPAPPANAPKPPSFFTSPGRVSRDFIGSIVSPAYTGATLETMAPQLREFFGAQGKTGLLVRSVDPNSPAAVAGLHAGDVVVRVNMTAIVTTGDWFKAVRENKGRTVGVVVLREHHEQTLTMTPNAKHHSGLFPDLWPHTSGHAAPVQQACLAETPFAM